MTVRTLRETPRLSGAFSFWVSLSPAAHSGARSLNLPRVHRLPPAAQHDESESQQASTKQRE